MIRNYSFVSNSYRLVNQYKQSKNLMEDLFKLINVLEKDCENMNMRQCQGTTKKGERCQNSGKAVFIRGGFCWKHS